MRSFLLIAMSLLAFAMPSFSQKKLKVLLVNGQNMYHKHWPEQTRIVSAIIKSNSRFALDVATSPAKGEDLSTFRPPFAKYDVVVSIYDGEEWAAPTRADFEAYMKNGGGFVSIHMADNSFPKWPAYNEMIGLGGWGSRNEKDGPYVYLAENGERVTDFSPGPGGHHGAQHSYLVETRAPEHPIMKGVPAAWLHAKDELYDLLRGPAKNLEILASAYSSKEYGGTGRDEPILMTITYGKGRIFHTVMGHDAPGLSCVGFITTLLRGMEWAATGKVTIPVPADFPTEKEVKQRQF